MRIEPQISRLKTLFLDPSLADNLQTPPILEPPSPWILKCQPLRLSHQVEAD